MAIRRTGTSYVQDTSKGKSFNFSIWDDLTAYNNNALTQDFVSYSGALYVCINSVQAGDIDPKTDTADGTIDGNYWVQVVRGIEGPKGDDGKVYVPTVSSTGTISWKLNSGVTPKSTNIKGPQGDPGAGLEFQWSGTKLLVRQEGTNDWTSSPDLKSNLVYAPTLKNGKLIFEPTSADNIQSIDFGTIKGKDGASAYEIAVKRGFKGTEAEWIRSLANQVGSLPMRNIILRVDTDSAQFPDEKYCGTHIQWKYDSDDYIEWNNLLQINQLMNLAFAGLNLNYNGTVKKDGKNCYHLSLDYNEVDYVDANTDKITLGPKIRTISDVYIPILGGSGDGGGGGDDIDTDKQGYVSQKSFTVGPAESCEYYFNINDPKNVGWTLTTHPVSWIMATPGGADSAFTVQEGEDSVFTPCETLQVDSVVSGTGSALVIICVEENTGSSRNCNLTFTSGGVSTNISVTQTA